MVRLPLKPTPTKAQMRRKLARQAAIRKQIRSLTKRGEYGHDDKRVAKLEAEYDALEQETRSGKCRNCGRPLTDPESLARGYGPLCFAKLFPHLTANESLEVEEPTEVET